MRKNYILCYRNKWHSLRSSFSFIIIDQLKPCPPVYQTYIRPAAREHFDKTCETFWSTSERFLFLYVSSFRCKRVVFLLFLFFFWYFRSFCNIAWKCIAHNFSVQHPLNVATKPKNAMAIIWDRVKFRLFVVDFCFFFVSIPFVF